MKPSPPSSSAPTENEVAWRSLLRRAQAGESAAYEELARLLGRRLRGFLLRRGAPPAELDDLAIETLEKIFQRLETVRNGDLLPWAFKIARNHLHDHFARRRQPTVPAELAEEVPAPARGPRPAASPLVLAVRRWLRDLPPDDRHLLEGRGSGIPYEELAAEIGITSAAARQRAGRLLKRLETHLCADPALAAELKHRLGPLLIL